MSPLATSKALQIDSTSEPRDFKPWLIAILLALLVHLVLLLSKFSWPVLAPTPPPRVDIQQIDPNKLEQIRKAWKRDLLISKNQAKSETAPEDARFESDRNIRVEKETRAAQTDVLPKPGSAGEANDRERSQSGSNEAAKSATRAKAAPKLSSLGIPILKRSAFEPEQDVDAREAERAARESARAHGSRGADQTVLDKRLMVGAENMLNAVESRYYSFYSRLYSAVAPIWQSRIREVPYRRNIPPGDYTTQVEVILDQQGNLVRVNLLQNSAITEFDRAAIDSWYRIGRFPNPPKDLLDNRGIVRTGWTFTVQVGEGLQWQSLPPQRQY